MAQAESDDVVPDSPVRIWVENHGLSDSKIHSEYINRLVSGRDMHVVITAASETGVGKTTLAFALAMLWDQTGWTADKATLDPREYSVLYDDIPPGSVLILDEAEQAADKRRGMSRENVELGHAFATKRYRQIFGILTAPTRSWIDNRIGSDSADYWIQCQETDQGRPKGEAKVYRLKTNEHYESDYSTRTETISWPILDWHPEFKRLEQKKIDRMQRAGAAAYIHRDEVERIKENYWNKASKKTRYGLIKGMYQWGLEQKQIAEILSISPHVEGVSQPRISQLVNSDSFEDAYKG